MANKKNTNDDMKVSDFNLQKLDSEKLEHHLAASIAMESNAAIFGRRGSGKTEISKQQIKAAGCVEAYINLSVLERVDLGGYPDIMATSRSEEFVNFILPKFYEPMVTNKGPDGKPLPVVALLDEVDKASPDLWAPLLEFVQFKSINGKKLPNLKSVIMTGNLISEGGNRPSLPLLDRAEKYLIEPSVDKWMAWAGKSGGIHPSITAYINDHNGELFGAVDPEDRYADPSPRGWTNASKLIQRGEANNVNNNVLIEKVAGSVGKQSGMKFKMYYQYYRDLLPLVDQIYEGKNIVAKYQGLDIAKRLIVGMIACSRFANKLDQHLEKEGKPINPEAKDVPKWVGYVGKFVEGMEMENSLVAIRSQIGADRFIKHQLCEAPYWGDRLTELNKSLRQD